VASVIAVTILNSAGSNRIAPRISFEAALRGAHGAVAPLSSAMNPHIRAPILPIVHPLPAATICNRNK
jgi:hypothetical protein